MENVSPKYLTAGLFGKFFAAIWGAILLLGAAVAVGSWFWISSSGGGAFAGGPNSNLRNTTAAHLLQTQGPDAVLRWSAGLPAASFETRIISENGRDMFGKPLTEKQAKAFAQLVQEKSRLIVPAEYKGELWYVGSARISSPPLRLLILRNPLPYYLTLIIAVVAAAILAALLAWHFSRPIVLLDRAMRSFAKGDLDVRVLPEIGHRSSELARLAERFDYLAQTLQSVLKSQEKLFHDISHELRSPLARIDVAVALAHRNPERVGEYLDRIERDVRRLDQLVGELLEYAKLDASANPSAADGMAPMDLTSILEEIADDARFEGTSAGVGMDARIEPGLVIEGNPEYLHRAVENIIRNSLAHSPSGSRIELMASRREGSILIEVKDQGPGVNESELENIFKPFVRGSRERTGTGHGLGLAIARQAIVLHRGTLSAANRPEGGLAVSITLPA